MIIKATPLQAWALAGWGGGARVGRHPPLPIENKNGGLFATFFFSYGGLFATFFSFWGPFCYFLLHGGGLFWACPPPPTKISAGTHDCKEGSRACSREMFLCDHNLVSSGHVLLRFCLKNDKNNNNNHLLGGDFEGMLIREKCWYMVQFEVYFDTIFPSENSSNLH